MFSLFSPLQIPSVAMSSSSRDMDVLETPAEHINLRDEEGDTVLFKSLKKNRSDAFIIRLLNDGADPNILSGWGESPLLVALRRDTMIVAQELVNKGAFVNARYLCRGTVLDRVVCCRKMSYNPQAICFLLYYEGNVDLQLSTGPFLKCLWCNNHDGIHQQFDYKNRDLEDTLNTVVLFQYDNDVAFILIKKGAQFDYVKWIISVEVLNWVLDKGGINLFKLMWERLYYIISIKTIGMFVNDLLKLYDINNNDWWDCLNFLLNSPIAFELAKELQSKFFTKFLRCCESRNVKLSDRLRIIYLALSLSIKVDFQDLVVAYRLFGFNEEVEILMYFTKYGDHKVRGFYGDKTHGLLDLFLGKEDHLCLWHWIEPPNYILLLGYFNRSYYNKFLLLSSETKEKMQFLPEFPSLLELCRTPIRQFIRQTYKVKEPYQFYDAVKQLNLPPNIEDVIRFKTPIYI